MTAQNAYVGMKVVRGKDWVWDGVHAPYSTGTVGTISKLTSLNRPGWIEVDWNNAAVGYSYRAGADGRHDLYIAPTNTTVPAEKKTIGAGQWLSEDGVIINTGTKVWWLNQDGLTHCTQDGLTHCTSSWMNSDYEGSISSGYKMFSTWEAAEAYTKGKRYNTSETKSITNNQKPNKQNEHKEQQHTEQDRIYSAIYVCTDYQAIGQPKRRTATPISGGGCSGLTQRAHKVHKQAVSCN